MSLAIASQADLARANIHMAWSMAREMNSDQFRELCRVTVQQWQRDGALHLTERALLDQAVVR